MCLRKDPRQRVQAMGDVRLALEGVFETAAPAATIERAAPRRPLWLRVAPFAALTAVAAAAIGFVALRPEPLPKVTRFQIHAPAGSTLPLGTPAISPDGSTIAHTVTDAQGVTRIHVRPLDRVDTRVLPGTENAVHPFWFPDGRSIGFATSPENYLKMIEIDAGAPRTLVNVTGPWHGTSNLDGTVLFTGGGGISRWSNGQTPFLELTRREGEATTAFPFFLPDGKRFLVFVRYKQGTSIDLATLGSQGRTIVVDGADGAALVARTPGGRSYLVYVRATDLLVQEFDEAAGVVRGSPKVLVSGIGLVANPPLLPAVGVSGGILAYQTGGAADVAPLSWFDRAGKEVGTLARGASVRGPRLSPDGGRVLGMRYEAGLSSLWVTDLRRGSPTRITFAGSTAEGVWSPDGTRVAYRRSAGLGVMVASADGSGERQVSDSISNLGIGPPMAERCLRASGPRSL